jgi:hypothetical protein
LDVSFIFAATACRIFEDPLWDPVESIGEILDDRDRGLEFGATYSPVLDRLLKGQPDDQTHEKQLRLNDAYQSIISTIVILAEPRSISSLSKLLRIRERVVGG